MKLAVVVVFYNPSEENIKNIKNYLQSVDQVYVIDNSEDKVIRLQDTKKIKYIKLGENKGIAYALNKGANLAIEDQYEYLLTLDQDSLITSEIIKGMKSYLIDHASEKIGLISPYQDIDSKEEVSKVEAEEMIEVMTSGNIINLDAYQKIKGFKDWLFIDCVDTEYCMNLNQHGYKVVRLNQLKMKHKLGNLTIHKLGNKTYPCYNHNPIRRYYIMRNTLYIKKMYGSVYKEYTDHLIRVQKGQVKRILAFESQKFAKLKMMYKGYRDFKKGKKGKLD